jgi:multiple sugar transport system permease protein
VTYRRISLESQRSMQTSAMLRALPVVQRRRLTKHLTPYLLIAPAGLALALLLAYPWAFGLYASLTNLRLTRLDQAQFIGVDNYVRLLTSGQFFTAAGVTFTFALMCITSEMTLGLGLALLLNRQIKGVTFYRAIFLIPFMTPVVVCGLMWRQILDVNGVMNYFLGFAGIGPVAWLATTQTVLFGLLIVDVWQTTPQVILLLLAGLQAIPHDLYEAATIDGATGWQAFRFVTLPLLLPFFLVSLAIRSIELIQVLDIILVTTQGGPAEASLTLHIAAYREAFVSSFLGSGIAYAFLLGFVVLVVALLILRQSLAAQAAALGD